MSQILNYNWKRNGIKEINLNFLILIKIIMKDIPYKLLVKAWEEGLEIKTIFVLFVFVIIVTNKNTSIK